MTRPMAAGGCRVLVALCGASEYTLRLGGRALTAANVAVHTDRLLGQTLNDTVWSSIMAVDPFLHVVELKVVSSTASQRFD